MIQPIGLLGKSSCWFRSVMVERYYSTHYTPISKILEIATKILKYTCDNFGFE